MLRDQRRLRSLVEGLRAPRASLESVAREIERSVGRRRQRRERALSLAARAIVPDLPILAHQEEILRALETSQVIVVCGETGSGKTTQLPKLCLAAGRGSGGMIGHTQPRRVAARTVAARIAEELGVPLGGERQASGRADVGYRVRFEGRAGLDDGDTLVKVMTDGILLAEAAGGDRLLESYDTIIIDEAHERSLNIDFLLGYLRPLLPSRPDLRVIITSATIDPKRFSEHFGGAPIIEVSGRTHPVEVRYRPIEPIDGGFGDESGDEDDLAYQQAIVRAAKEALGHPPASASAPDLLVFLSGEREIRTTSTTLRKHLRDRVDILPLYARLSTAEQDKVFRRSDRAGRRRIVLATNVAETSVTVPGIGIVIDPGLARVGRYSPKHKVQRLLVEPISRASADQRAGRCGRIAPGVCIRLYAREHYEQRPRFTDPEILRTNLASVILQMRHLGLGEVSEFPFLDPPEHRRIRDGLETLHELGAIDDQERLTPLGRHLARFPLDPRVGRMVLAGGAEGCLDEVLIVAAALSVQDPRQRPADDSVDGDRALSEYRSAESDFVGTLRLWSAYNDQLRGTGGGLRRWCRDHLLSPARMREWRDVHAQLVRLTRSMGTPKNARANGGRRAAPNAGRDDDVRHLYARLHRALLTGLIGNIGVLGDAREYTGTRDLKFSIHPGSGLFKASHKWVVASELVRTTRLYARQAARIQPQWVERAAPHLVKRSYSEPHWDERTARVLASEHVTLWGLDLIEGRKVHYGPIDPAAARQVFIQQGLVEGRHWTTAAFAKHNRSLLGQVEAMRARLRRSDLTADAEAQYAFYDRYIPRGVTTGMAFEGWLRHESRRDPRVLCMNMADVLGEQLSRWPMPVAAGDESDLPLEALRSVDPGGARPTAPLAGFPDVMDVAGLTLPLRYRFSPGEPDDGITLLVPLAALSKLRGAAANRLEWLVPGMFEEKVVALLRALPKDLRRRLGPAADAARRCLSDVRFGEGDLASVLRERVGAMAGAEVPGGVIDVDRIPAHLRLNFRVVRDDAGGEEQVLAEGRDLREIRAQIGAAAATQAGAEADSPWIRDGVKSWDFGEMPSSVTPASRAQPGAGIVLHPAVVDPAIARRPSVALRLFGDARDAASAMRWGVRRLIVLRCRAEFQSVLRYMAMSELDSLRLLYSLVGPIDSLEDDLIDLVAERVYFAGPEATARANDVRSREQFDSFVDSGWHRLAECAAEAGAIAEQILRGYQAVRDRMDRLRGGPAEESAEAIESQMRELLPDRRAHAPGGFLATTPWERLIQIPRYLKAAERRLDKMGLGGMERDTQMSDQIVSFLAEMREIEAERRAMREGAVPAAVLDADVEAFRWLIEEFRVSLFAQELGTTEPVSAKRLQRRLAELRQISS